ncbi:histidine kinase [Algoriphagus sp. D3-2-R+10]|uniref:tetratricopeptide repeat-containing sensor histidine kinase n=1 Tax=Algoriphagus aurantiacus TaxID=3103948 RepID=UPI002B380C56|nr:ATP-binding protein [Algoriphagus sp. D3-2-R+10]MEB2774785.1 histidine kinase [Algoriphagus sp. D3-2-R+10]
MENCQDNMRFNRLNGVFFSSKKQLLFQTKHVAVKLLIFLSLKMIRLIFSLGFVLATFSTILSSLAKTAQDTIQRNNLDELIALFEASKPSDSIAGVYLSELINLSEKEGKYDLMADHVLRYINHPSSIQIPELKRQLLKRAITHEDELSKSQDKGNLHLKLAGDYFSLEQFDSAITEYSVAIERFSEKDSIFIADSYFFRGQARDYKGDLLGGLQDYQTARDIYLELGDSEYVNYVDGGMAILFSKFAIYNEAEKIRNSLISTYEETSSRFNVAIQLYNKSEDFGKQGRYKDQLASLLKADSLTPFDPRDYYTECMIKLSLSNYYGEHGDLKKQQEYFDKAKEMIPQVPEIATTNPVFLNAKALLAYSQGNLSQANQLAQESLSSAKESKNMDHLIKAYRLLGDTYNELGQSAKAYQINQELTNYTDSIFAANQAATFSYYQTLYETERKEKEILAKTQEIESISQRNKTRLTVIAVIVFIFILTAVLIFLWKNLQHEKKKKEMQSRFSQELLKNQEAERVRISKDLHDGLGQSLLLIKNKVALSKDNTTGELLDTAISELRSIARSLHPMQLEKLGLSKAAEHLLHQIDQETDIFVSSEIEELRGVLKKEQELQLYRILQESINNVLKHSEASALRVLFKRTEKGVELKIEDNGKGFDFSEKLNDFQSLGLKTLKERIASIQGSMKINSEKGVGTSLSFIVYA